MKRLVILLAAAAAFCTLAFGTSAAKADNGQGTDWQLTLSISPSTIAVGDPFNVSGNLMHKGDTAGVVSKHILVLVYTGAGCSSGNEYAYYNDTIVTDDAGHYEFLAGSAFAGPPRELYPAGTYSVQAFANVTDEDVVSSCVPLTISETPNSEPATTEQHGEIGVFLCYSKWQVDPGVWPYGVAKTLMEGGGYWLPFAVPGNVDFGTNIGDYHLVCNVAATQSANGSILGAGEDVYSPDVAKAAIGDTFGPFYPVVGGG